MSLQLLIHVLIYTNFIIIAHCHWQKKGLKPQCRGKCEHALYNSLPTNKGKRKLSIKLCDIFYEQNEAPSSLDNKMNRLYMISI